jgi:hypothetical protein
LIYCLNKKTGNKWAIAAKKTPKGKAEYFDKNDDTITKKQFDVQSGLKSDDLLKKAFEPEVDAKVQSSRKKYSVLIGKIKAFIKTRPKDRNADIEELLVYTKSDLVGDYMKRPWQKR